MFAFSWSGYSVDDPFEDTERILQAGKLEGIKGYSVDDPFEDTERQRPKCIKTDYCELQRRRSVRGY